MLPGFSLRYAAPLVLAMLVCSCSTPEEKADAAFAELCSVAREVCTELAGITDEASAGQAVPRLEEQAELLRELLEELDELALEPDMNPEARRRVGQHHHEPLKAVVESNEREIVRLARQQLYHSKPLEQLLRRVVAHYSNKRVHPWARAVLAGREYRPKARRK